MPKCYLQNIISGTIYSIALLPSQVYSTAPVEYTDCTSAEG